MTDMYQQQPGGEQQPLPASGLLAFSTTRRGEPSRLAASPRHSDSTETNVSSTPGRPRAEAANTPRQPGQWPTARVARLAEDHPRANADRARFHVVMGCIKAMLQEQPSPRTVRATSRRICNVITQLADDVAEAKREAA